MKNLKSKTISYDNLERITLDIPYQISWLNKKTNEMYLTNVVDSWAISEVYTYNLCKKLGLPCLESHYIRDEKFPLVSLTKVKSEWKHTNNDFILDNKGINNYDDYVALYILFMLLDNKKNDMHGYIIDNNFYKACNGLQLWSMLEFAWYLSTGEQYYIDKYTVHNIDSFSVTQMIKNSNKGLHLKDKIVDLSDSDIKEIIALPDHYKHKENAESFLLNKIKNMQKNTEDLDKCLSSVA